METTGKNLSRRAALASIGGLAVSAIAQASPTTEQPGNYLMIDQAGIEAVLAKAKRCPWADESLKKLIARAESKVAEPLDIPDRGGQWGHWYTCKKDGSTLIADSPTRHRCPRCGEIYTGEPYDSVYLTRIHGGNSAGVRDLGLAFRFTGRAEFAARAGELLTGYAKKYLSYPHRDPYNKDTVNAGRVGSQTLDESTWIIPMAWGYSLVRSTLKKDERETIEHDLLLAAADTIIGRSYPGLPNIQCWKDTAIACVGFAVGNNDLVTEALDHPVRGFRHVMSRFVLPGGLWYEASLGYHHYTLHAVWGLLEAAKHNGIDLYANENYRSLFDGPIALAFPDGSVPGFNDNAGPRLSQWAPVYELAYAHWKREEYGRVLAYGKRDSLQALLYGADSVPTGSPVPKTSVLLREAGYAQLRTATVSVATRFGLHGSGHGHPDKLNILTYGAGKMFGVDPGSIGYGVPLFFEWHKATISHNTVSVDEKQQLDANARVTQWKTNGDETVIEGETDTVYPGVMLRRALRLKGSTLDDRFTCESKDEHTYDWLFHAQGTLETSLDARPRTEPVAKVSGYQHIHDVKEAKVSGNWTATWKNGGSSMTLHFQGEEGTTVYLGVGPGPDPAVDVPLVLVRRKAAKTAFVVTHTFQG